MLSVLRCLVAAAAAAALGWLALAGEEGKQVAESVPAAEPNNASPDEIARLVEQLDAKRFADRQAASERLQAIGKPAIAALAKAAQGDRLEATIRAIDLLRKFLESSDPSTRSAAEEALRSIAKDGPPGPARRAQEALDARQPPGVPNLAPGRIIQGGIQLGFGNARRVSVRMTNGVREIDAEENGEKVKIREEPGQGVTVEVTKKKDGKDATETYRAKSVEDLKKNHPAGYEAYRKFAENQGGVFQFQVQVQAGGLAPQPPLAANLIARHRVESAALNLKNWERHLEMLVRDLPIGKAPQASRDELKKQVAEFQAKLAALENEIKKAEAEAKRVEKPEQAEK